MANSNEYKILEPLSDDKIRELLRSYRLGNMEAYQELIFRNIRLIWYLMKKKFATYPYSKEDLYSAGKYGLMLAIANFSLERDIKFVTYASTCISHSMTNFAHKEAKEKKGKVSFEKYIEEDEDEKDFLIDTTINFEEDISKGEILQKASDFILEISSKRDRDILIDYLGLNGKAYSKSDLAVRYKLSLAQICRIISKDLKYIALRLEEVGLLELSDKEREFYNKRATSLLELLDCSETELQELLASLSLAEINLLKFRNGSDLTNYNQRIFPSRSVSDEYYRLIWKLRRLIKLRRFKEDTKEERPMTRSLLASDGIKIEKVLIKR